MNKRKFRTVLKDRKLSGGLLLILSGLFFIIIFLLKDKVKTQSDLVEFDAVIKDFSFSEYKGLRNHTYKYFLYLKGYRNQFQIIADFMDYFRKDYFEQTLSSGDKIRIEISRQDFNKIHVKQKIKLFGISDDKAIYMNSIGTIHQYNNTFPFYAGLLSILVGFILFYFNWEKLQVKK